MKPTTAVSVTNKDFEWNAAQGDFPSDRLLHQLFGQQAAKTPEAPAVIYEDRTLSYRQLDRESDALSCRLQAAGVRPSGLVALLSERSPEMVVGMLAILKVGAAYLPLDPSYSAQRIELIVDDARPFAVLLQDHLRGKFPSKLQIPLLSLEGKSSTMGCPFPAELSAESLAYVLYTSGSTGKPKGVMIPHRAVCGFLDSIQATHSLRPEDRVLQKTAYTFDLSVPEFFSPLVTGAAMVLSRPGFEADPAYLVPLINAQHISTIYFVPSTLALFLNHPQSRSCHSLKRVLCVGEPLPANTVARFFSALPDTELYNVYGPTETTVFMTAWKCRPADALLHNVPIGLPLPNMQVYIVDEQMVPVATGTTGELCIAGAQLGIGYLNRPEVTEKLFVPNPFGEGQLYKTGDLARYREDGAIEFHGRIDHQVKINGLRIELGEIEATLRKHPAVRDCVVVVREERLVAYIVATGLSPEDLRQHARQTLPSYMVPSLVIFLEKLPLTSNGKVDRPALPAPIIVVVNESGRVSPRTAIETQLAAIWEKVLSIQPIGVTDNFFSELAGTSMQAVQIFSHINRILRKQLPLATLFESPTIERLAQKMSLEPRPENWRPLVAIQLSGSRPPFFAIHGEDGNVLFYRRFSEFLGREQPFYALQSQGLDGNPITRTTVEAIAAYYLEEIRNFQPHGPYLLGGYSFGGLVSYEIAHELRAIGEEVALLVLFDTSNPANPPRGRSWMEVARYRVPRLLSRGTNPERVFEYLAQRIRGKLGAQLFRWNERFHSVTTREQNDPAKLLDLRIRMAHARASLNYRPRPYPGKITLFRSWEQPIDYEADPDLGWGTVAQGVEVHDVPGHHTSIFWDDKNLSHLAKRVAECIRSCLASKRGDPQTPCTSPNRSTLPETACLGDRAGFS